MSIEGVYNGERLVLLVEKMSSLFFVTFLLIISVNISYGQLQQALGQMGATFDEMCRQFLASWLNAANINVGTQVSPPQLTGSISGTTLGSNVARPVVSVSQTPSGFISRLQEASRVPGVSQASIQISNDGISGTSGREGGPASA